MQYFDGSFVSFWVLLAFSAVTAYLLHLIKTYLLYWKLIKYTEINLYAAGIKTDRVEQLFGELLAQKTGLLLHRWRTLAKKLESEEAISAGEAFCMNLEISACERILARNPYNHHLPPPAFPVVPHSLSGRIHEFLDDMRKHSLHLEVYTKLFQIPRRIT